MPSRRRRYSSDESESDSDSGHSVSCSCAQCRRMALDRHRPGCRCSTCKRKGTGSRRYGSKRKKKKKKKRRRSYSSDSSSNSDAEVAKDAARLLKGVEAAAKANNFGPSMVGQTVQMQSWLGSNPASVQRIPDALAATTAPPTSVAGRSSLRAADNTAPAPPPLSMRKKASSWGDVAVQEAVPLVQVIGGAAETVAMAPEEEKPVNWKDFTAQQAKKKERKKKKAQVPKPTAAAAVKWSESSLVKKTSVEIESPRTQIPSTSTFGRSFPGLPAGRNAASATPDAPPPLPPRPTSQLGGQPLPPRYGGAGNQYGKGAYGGYGQAPPAPFQPAPPPRPASHAAAIAAFSAGPPGPPPGPPPGQGAPPPPAPPGPPPGPPPGSSSAAAPPPVVKRPQSPPPRPAVPSLQPPGVGRAQPPAPPSPPARAAPAPVAAPVKLAVAPPPARPRGYWGVFTPPSWMKKKVASAR